MGGGSPGLCLAWFLVSPRNPTKSPYRFATRNIKLRGNTGEEQEHISRITSKSEMRSCRAERGKPRHRETNLRTSRTRHHAKRNVGFATYLSLLVVERRRITLRARCRASGLCIKQKVTEWNACEDESLSLYWQTCGVKDLWMFVYKSRARDSVCVCFCWLSRRSSEAKADDLREANLAILTVLQTNTRKCHGGNGERCYEYIL